MLRRSALSLAQQFSRSAEIEPPSTSTAFSVLNARHTLQCFKFSTSRTFLANSSEFEDAKKRLGSLEEDPGPDTKLKIYGLFKQATTGTCNTSKPGMMDIVGKAKWNAWNALGSMSKEDAEKQYVSLVNELAGQQPETSSAASSSESSGKFKEITYEERDNLTFITLNRPQKMNAITATMYFEIGDALNTAASNKTVATVITGAGKMFSAGNDLSTLTKPGKGGMKKLAEDAAVMLEKFVAAFIDHPKVLIGLVNGPCIGIACTTMGLYDIVYVSDAAYFHTPFTALGLTPEGCSSYIFPRRMGPIRANEMLLLNRKMSAAEAQECGFITDVFPAANFQQETDRKLQEISKLPPNSLRESKIMIRKTEKDILHRVNHDECTQLITSWQGEECISAAMKFLSRKS